jgi:hypothetical protein
MGSSTYTRDRNLNLIRTQDNWVSFNNGDPGPTGTGGTDVTTAIRTAGRVQIPSGAWAAISNDGNKRRTSNNAAVSFGNAVNVQPVTHAILWDAATGGNCIHVFVNIYTSTAGADVTIGVGAIVLESPYGS